jgi:hypothetical protein
MPEPRSEGEIKSKWERFVRALRSVLTGLPEHRHQDQFLEVKTAALALAESPAMANEIAKGYQQAAAGTNDNPALAADAVDVVVLELEAFPRAVEVHEEQKKAGTAKPGAGKKLREAAKTVLGSVGDLFKLTDYGKGVLTVMKEAIDLVGGD